jgi:hypothetical protein
LKESSLTEELRLQFLQMKILKRLLKEVSFNLEFLLIPDIQKKLAGIDYLMQMNKSTK